MTGWWPVRRPARGRCAHCEAKDKWNWELKERFRKIEEKYERLRQEHSDGCGGCYEKQRENDRLKDENQRLRGKLNRYERQTKEGYFGSSTPSSQIPVKPNTPEENRRKNGGAKKGQKGHGRRPVNTQETDQVESVAVGNHCPTCAGDLVHKGTQERVVIDLVPIQVKKIVYRCEKKWCPHCQKTIEGKPPVLPRSMYGNHLIAQTAAFHYGHGIPEGKIDSILGQAVPSGTLFEIFHRVARLWEPAVSKLVMDFRKEKVLHADETGWRTDGHSGYAWIFCSETISLFRFMDSRSAKTPKSVLGSEKLPGVLVVDRYPAYNKAPCRIQYCWVHLKRDVEDLEKEFDDDPEVRSFVGTLEPLMSKVIRLRNRPISKADYKKKAKTLKRKVQKIINAPARHLGIRNIQFIFHKHQARLFHWVSDRNIPADNNRAERELRPTVIARKVSFGSQSEQGAKTRSIWMTILYTAQKRLKNQSLVDWLKTALDQFVANPNVDPYSLLPPVTNNRSRRRPLQTARPP